VNQSDPESGISRDTKCCKRLLRDWI